MRTSTRFVFVTRCRMFFTYKTRRKYACVIVFCVCFFYFYSCFCLRNGAGDGSPTKARGCTQNGKKWVEHKTRFRVPPGIPSTNIRYIRRSTYFIVVRSRAYQVPGNTSVSGSLKDHFGYLVRKCEDRLDIFTFGIFSYGSVRDRLDIFYRLDIFARS